MRTRLIKYYSIILILLVFTVNANYAVTVGLCAMGMEHSEKCCCTDPTAGNKTDGGAYITKKGCCAEQTTEFSNSADFESLKRIEGSEFVFLFSVNSSEDTFNLAKSSTLYYPDKKVFSPDEDIPIKHSSLLI